MNTKIKTATYTLALFAIVASAAEKAVPISTDGTDPKTWDMKQDGVLVAPQNHKVIYEDNYVRVLSVTVPAGTEELYHLHPYYSVIVRDSSPPAEDVLDRCANGVLCVNPQIVDAIIAPVLVRVVPPQAVHSAKNNGSQDIHQTRVEFKTGIIPKLIHPDWPNGKMPISSDGSDPTSWNPKEEGKVIAAGSHKVIYEDANICVQSVSQLPGVTEPFHNHPYPAVMIAYGDLPRRVSDTTADGKRSAFNLDGTGSYAIVRVIPAQEIHATTNVGTTSAPLIRIDFKKGLPQ